MAIHSSVSESGHRSNMAYWAQALKLTEAIVKWWVPNNKHQETRENCEDSYGFHGFRSSDPQSPGLNTAD